MIRWTLLVFAVACVLLVGCGQKSQPAGIKILKVAVFHNGDITADGVPVTFDELQKKFQELALENGVVKFYREDQEPPPWPIADQIIKAMLVLRLPVHLSTRPDFSD